MSDSAPQTVTRVCPRCSAQATTTGEFCSHCGASYNRVNRRSTRRAILIALATLVLVLVATGGVLAKIQHDANVKEQQAAAAQQEEADAQAAQDASDDQEREARHDLVKELRKNITKTARKAVRTGVLDGPIKYTSCTATGGGSTDDLTALTGTFECIAVNKENTDGTVSGYGYNGTVDWESGEITWQIQQ